MPRTKADNAAQYRYNAAHLKRVPLDLQLAEYARVKDAATAAGETVNGYIKTAIRARMQADGVQTAPPNTN